MKKLTIDNKVFNLKEIKQLYPAAIIKTGYEDETTEMSLEWIESESKGRVELVGYALFVVVGDNEKYSFMRSSKEALDSLISEVAKQIK